MATSKYVSFDNDGFPTAVIFPDVLTHAHIASALRFECGEPIGAGFVNVRDGEVFPYGRSESLDLGPHPDDQLALKRALGLVYE